MNSVVSMKAITIYQPWASLIAVGAKKYETRSWATSHRGKIAIHAGKKKACIDELPLPNHKAISKALVEHFYPDWHKVPFGAVIATAELVECKDIRHAPPRYGYPHGFTYVSDGLCGGIEISGNEFLFGDWTPGRWAWQFANVQMLPKPVPVRGKQGLWDWRSD